MEQDRTDDRAVKKQFERFRRDIRKRFPDLYYVAVMERHKNGCIHFHLVLGGATAEDLKLIDSGHKDNSGRTIYNCFAWKYGFSTFISVDDTEKVSGYIMKYIGKDAGVEAEFKKRYWVSRNCSRPKKKFFDFVHDTVLNVKRFFEKAVERSVTMVTDYWHKKKNYLVVRDYAPALRRFRFDRVGLCVYDGVWRTWF